MSYFNRFPVFQYDVNGEGDRTLLTDFTANFKIRNDTLIKNISYLNYQIVDGERPDIISHKLYGTADYHWTFFIINDSLRTGHNSWPLSQYEFDTHVSDKYDKYSCVAFDPTIIYNSDDNIGNLSYIDFNPSGGSLYLYPMTLDEGEYVAAEYGHKIESYDHSSCQLAFSRKNSNFGSISNLDNYEYYTIKFEGTEEAEEAYISNLKAAYEIDDENFDVYSILYKVAIDDNADKLVYEYLKNAPYQYYETDTITNEDITLNGFDVVRDGVNGELNFLDVKKITYTEMETILNDRKRFIRVINPNNINDFVSSYFKVLSSNGR